jgi:hypothetical protein
LGSVDLLQGPLTAFFASRQCPGTAIQAATAWALEHAQGRGGAVIGGFLSPLEQSVLRLLREAGCPAVVVLARVVAGAHLKSTWRRALDAGKMAVVSGVASKERLTQRAASDRNELAAHLADRIVIGHTNTPGALAQQCTRWQADGLILRHFGVADAFR